MDWYFVMTLASTGLGVAAAAHLAAAPVAEPPLERRRRDALRRRSFVYRHLPRLAAALARTHPLCGGKFTGGAGTHVRLTDPAWPAGEVRVVRRCGGYVVTNGRPHAAYLDGRAVGPGGVRNLRHGATLQPTAATLLRLVIVDAPPGAPAGGVVAEPPVVPPGRGRVRRTLVRGFLLLVVLVYAAAALRPPPRVDAVAAAVHREAIAAVEADPRHATFAVRLRAAREAVRDAVYLESKGDAAAAHLRYRDARDRLAALQAALTRPDPAAGRVPDAEAVTRPAAAAGFVADRLTATARR